MKSPTPAYATRPRPKPSARVASSSRCRARDAITDADAADDRFKVQHDYHDHARELPPDGDASAPEDAAEPARSVPRGGVSVQFPAKLHVMLSRVEEEGLAHIVSWQPHGRCFLVHKPQEFVTKVMPLYFHQSKLTSFQRQLNLYGFVRITKNGKDRGAYYHELFLRHKLFLCRKMVRIRIKGTGIKGKASPESEPDFYNMPPIDAAGSSGIEGDMEAAIEKELQRRKPAKRKSSKKRQSSKRAGKKKDAGSKKPKREEPPEDDGYIYSGYSSPRDAPTPPPSAWITPDAVPKESAFRRLSQDYFAGLCPPSLSSDSEDATEPHSGDDLVFEGQHFHYIDSLATRVPKVALEPKKKANPRTFHTLMSSLSESSLSVAKSMREPILTPSTSSSSLTQFRQDESLGKINPATIFAEKEAEDGKDGWVVGGKNIDGSMELDPWEKYVK